jgi:putative membrane fusion protein
MRDGAVTAQTAGVLIYHVDGLEGSLNPAGAAAWTPSWFRTLAVPLRRSTGEGQVRAGAPLFKVVDNISQGLVLVVPADRVASLSTGNWVQLRSTGRDGLVEARITRMVREGSEVLLHLTAPTLPEDLAGRRKLQVSLVLSDYTGKVVPRSAIDVRDGLQGVWIWEGKQPEFRPAPVIGGNQQELVLETDLPDGTRILRAALRSMP